ncbi:MAG TPA: protein kinase [Planctomycetota bacterium]
MTSPIEKLGQLLLKQGLISPSQLAECLQEQRAKGSSTDVQALSDILLSHGYIDQATLTRALQAEGASWSSMADPAASSETPPEVVEARRDPKRVLQKFTLVGELGRGGMAVVYKAWDDALRMYVALKLIRTQDIGLEGPAGDAEIQDFLREARTAAKISHPNIVRVHELGRHDDRYFLSMEYVAGDNLEKLLRRDRKQPLCQEFYARPKRFLVILRDVALALDHAHRQKPPIVHRDIKPQNILVDGTGRACVVDFGLAREMSSGHTLTSQGIVRGTPSYMAPEQAIGRTGPGVDARTDVWALGAILYECLAGVPPFLGPTQRDILNKVVNEEPMPPSEIQRRRGSVHAVPAVLERICLQALEKDKARRTRSAREFADDLDRYMAGGTVRARGVGRHERAWRGLARHKGVLLAGAAALLMAIVAVVAVATRRDPEVVVEKVVVESDVSARARESQEKIAAMVDEMRFDLAARGYQELLANAAAGKEREEIQRKLSDVRLREALLDHLIVRIQERPRDLPSLATEDAVLREVRLLDATRNALFIRFQEKGAELPWGKLTAAQFVKLVRELCPRVSGEPALGYVAWSADHSLVGEATWAAESTRGTTFEDRAKALLAKAGIPWKETPRAPEPATPVVARPEPRPEPAPMPAPRARYRMSPLPPASDWTYVPAWQDHGPELAESLARRGWSDWAEELALNAINRPGAFSPSKATARRTMAGVHAAAAARAPSAAEQLKLLDWAAQGLRIYLAVSPESPGYETAAADLIRVDAARARAIHAAGFPVDATEARRAIGDFLQARLDDPRTAGDPVAQNQALYLLAAAALSQAQILRELDQTELVTARVGDAVKILEGELLWRSEGTLLAHQARALLAAVTLVGADVLPRSARAKEHGKVDHSLREARKALDVRATSPRAVATVSRVALAEAGIRNRIAAERRGPPGQAEAAKGLKALEELARRFPAARSGEFALPLRLEEIRALELADQPLRALKLLDTLPPAVVESLRDPYLARADPRDAEIVRARRAISTARTRGVRPAARDWYRLGAAYFDVGRDLEALESFSAMDDPRVSTVESDVAVDAALRRLACLARVHALSGEEADRRTFEVTRDRLAAKHGAAVDPSGPAFLALVNDRRPLAPPARSGAEIRDPWAFLYDVPGEYVATPPVTLPKAYAPRAARKLDTESEKAVLLGLRWLARHQAADGSWKSAGHVAACKRGAGGNCTPNPGYEEFDGGATGLALLAFLGAGSTHLSEETSDGDRFGEVTRKGLRWLTRQQDPEGCVGSRAAQKYMYNHAFGALALAEAYGMTGSALLRESAQKAVDFTVAAQNPGKGWRYSYKCGDNDSSVTGWNAMVLHAAAIGGLAFPKSAHEGISAWYDEVTEPSYARIGYTHMGTGKVFVPGQNEQFDHHEALTAIGIVARIFTERNRGDARAVVGCDLLMRDKPNYNGNAIDFYYWHVGSLALYQVDGPAGAKWRAWNEDMKHAICRNQVTSGCKAGSWETIDRWSGEGGRVYCTALNVLTLLTTARYAQTFEPGKK